MKRNRFHYAIAIVMVVVLGFLSRRDPQILPAALGKYPGDALWSLMLFCGMGFLLPNQPVIFNGLTAFAIGCAVEFFKLDHAAWIEPVRETWAGRLMLGSVFSWKNIAAYAIGILIGGILEVGFCKFRAKKNFPASHF
jgi:hypothetical protein